MGRFVCAEIALPRRTQLTRTDEEPTVYSMLGFIRVRWDTELKAFKGNARGW
jgi:hypothetical protein